MQKKILITGGAGYIGSHANALLNVLGFQTIVVDNLKIGHKESLQYSPLDLSQTRNSISKYSISGDSNMGYFSMKDFTATESRVPNSSLLEISNPNARCFSVSDSNFKKLHSLNAKNAESSLSFLNQLAKNFTGGGG